MVSVINNDSDIDRETRDLEEKHVIFDCSIEENSTGRVTQSGEIRVSNVKGTMKGEKVSCFGQNLVADDGQDVDLKRVDGNIKTSNEVSDGNGGTERLDSDVTSALDKQSSQICLHNGKSDKSGAKSRKGHVRLDKFSASQEDLTVPTSDEYEANGKDRVLEKPPGYGYEIGDMVWGKVKSHPWWPGHIYSEAFASPSVRRSKTEGYVLVAFFGDSSYGWFDPAELVPFDSNFPEKSRQTSSRTFAKAVEEAVDEASRRCGLGLACRCRNPYNFRPTTVPGYLSVDINDYESGTIYSEGQIRKARDCFKPREALDFVKELASSPTSNEHEDIQFIKNKATVLAHRKAVYEEFDETYAQAFGHQPVRPSRGRTQDLGQPLKEPTRAPLSGPLVIAEVLGKGKGSAKPNKSRDQAKKDRYLFKRRDDPNELNHGVQINTGQPVYVESSTIVAGDYSCQKRSSLVPSKHNVPAKREPTETKSGDGASDFTGKEDIAKEEKPAAVDLRVAGYQMDSSKAVSAANSPVGEASGHINHQLEARTFLKKESAVGQEIREGLGSEVGVEHVGRNSSGSEVEMRCSSERAVVTVESKDDIASSTSSKPDERSEPSTTNAKFLGESPNFKVDVDKKAKIRKRSVAELNSENSTPLIKKKRKKELLSSQNVKMHTSCGKGGSSVGNVAAKSMASTMEHQKEDKVSTSSSAETPVPQEINRKENLELELPHLLHDLQALALSPFYHMGRDPAVTRHVFLRFRSLVYQKSLSSSLVDGESNETHTSEPPAVTSVSDTSAVKVREHQPSKSKKPAVRPGDPTKVGEKRGPSDRQEEIALKKKKKINDIKVLTAEKRTAQKSPVVQRGDGKEASNPTVRSFKTAPVKRPELPLREPEPTMLVMKFPPQGTLPSPMELQARFARFGQLDHSATRIFWKTLTCRVVYRHKADAESAYRFAVGSSNLFGNTGVRCFTKEVTPPEKESGKARREDSSAGPSPSKNSAFERRPAASLLSQSQQQQQQGVQLKSILKKSNGDETTGNGGRGTTRVKFILGEEEPNRSRGEDQLMIGNNFNNNPSFAVRGPSSTSHHGMDFNSKNIVIPPSPFPNLPQPSTTITTTAAVQFPRPPNNLHYTEVPPRNLHNISKPSAPPISTSAPSVDISQQMMILLTRCNDVVNNLKDMFGYVPYHPL